MCACLALHVFELVRLVSSCGNQSLGLRLRPRDFDHFMDWWLGWCKLGFTASQGAIIIMITGFRVPFLIALRDDATFGLVS